MTLFCFIFLEVWDKRKFWNYRIRLVYSDFLYFLLFPFILFVSNTFFSYLCGKTSLFCMCCSVIGAHLSLSAAWRIFFVSSPLCSFCSFVILYRYGQVFSLSDDGLLKFPVRNSSCLVFCFTLLTRFSYLSA